MLECVKNLWRKKPIAIAWPLQVQFALVIDVSVIPPPTTGFTLPPNPANYDVLVRDRAIYLVHQIIDSFDDCPCYVHTIASFGMTTMWCYDQNVQHSQDKFRKSFFDDYDNNRIGPSELFVNTHQIFANIGNYILSQGGILHVFGPGHKLHGKKIVIKGGFGVSKMDALIFLE